MPGARQGRDPVIVGQAADETQSGGILPKGQAHAGMLRSNNSLSTSTFSSHSQNARFAPGSVAIFCEGKHLLLDRVARNLQQQLSKQGMIYSVIYFPAGHEAPGQCRLPDVFVTLSLARIDESKSPLGLKLNATVICQAGTSLFPGVSHTHYSDSPPRLTFGMTSRLQHRSEYIGIESRSLRYAQQAEDIAKQFHKALVDQFRKWRDEHGLLPDLPDFLYGGSAPAPEFPFLQGENCRKVLSGSALLTQNSTTWTFKDDRPTLEVLKEYRDHLRQLGFSGGDRLDSDTERPPEDLRMNRGNEHMAVYRRQERDLAPGTMQYVDPKEKAQASPSPPFVTQYTLSFTQAQRESALSKLLDSGTDLETVLIFERQFRTPDLRARLFDLLKQTPVGSMRSNLALVQLYELKTNKPLYLTRGDYKLTYSDADMPTHYAFKVGNGVEAIAREYERVRSRGPDELKMGQDKAQPRLTQALSTRVKSVIERLDDQGRWVGEGRLRSHGEDDPTRRVIDCRTFISNMRVLCDYLDAE